MSKIRYVGRIFEATEADKCLACSQMIETGAVARYAYAEAPNRQAFPEKVGQLHHGACSQGIEERPVGRRIKENPRCPACGRLFEAGETVRKDTGAHYTCDP